MNLLPSDPNVVAFIGAQNTLQGLQTTHRLMHMAGSFGRPGSLTEGGRRHRQTADRLTLLNLTAIIYATQRGWIDPAEVQFGDEPFAIDESIDWHVLA
jgi:hypothetical protein